MKSPSFRNTSEKPKKLFRLVIGLTIIVLIYLIVIAQTFIPQNNTNLKSGNNDKSKILSETTMLAETKIQSKTIKTQNSKINTQTTEELPNGCLKSTPYIDRGRHIVAPPAGPITLVCCQTTKGPMTIAVHSSWAPIGAQNFLNMVKSDFFSSEVPLFRALNGFLVQFGLAGNVTVQNNFEKKMGKGRGFLEDDPHWLPLGPPGREINGSYRFQKGYIAYAGGGKNSRGTQLIIAFDKNKYLGGGSPWEVPFGQVVGNRSLRTLNQIYTGYNEKPSKGKIRNRGKEYTMNFMMDYMTSCNVNFKARIHIHELQFHHQLKNIISFQNMLIGTVQAQLTTSGRNLALTF
eukprot:gene7709-15776_t